MNMFHIIRHSYMNMFKAIMWTTIALKHCSYEECFIRTIIVLEHVHISTAYYVENHSLQGYDRVQVLIISTLLAYEHVHIRVTIMWTIIAYEHVHIRVLIMWTIISLEHLHMKGASLCGL